MPGLLDSDQAARRLGVKLPTLYAYVSRGLIESHPSADPRRRLFVAEEVESLARRARGGRASESKVATVTTGVTQLRDDGHRYRGAPAVDLARTTPYEEVAELLWGSEASQPAAAWTPVRLRPPTSLARADRLVWAVLMVAARDKDRNDLRPEAVRRAGRRLVATLAAVVRGGAPAHTPTLVVGGRRLRGSVAGILATGLVTRPRPAHVRAVNAAMVLLADHELAASTLAVRVAASTRADPYDAVLAGLGAMAGPLHSGAPLLATTLLHEARRVGPARAVEQTLAWHGSVPGFGHAVYTSADPRFVALEELLGQVAAPRWVELLAQVVDAASGRGVPAPNVDLALAALSLGLGMAQDAGRVVFTVARVAGWIAHYLEEVEEPPLRYRTRAIYATRS